MTFGDLKFKVMNINLNRAPPLPKMNPHVKYLDSIARTAACGLVAMSDGPIVKSKRPMMT